MTESEQELREQLVAHARRVLASCLVRGTSGNLSARPPGAEWCLVTPSGVGYETMRGEDLVKVDLAGQPLGAGLKPAADTPVPYSPPLEEAFLPNAEKVIEKARWLFQY